MNRRHFLMSTAVMAGSAAVKGLAQSPNETVRVAVIGLGGRGASHVTPGRAMPNVEIVAPLRRRRVAHRRQVEDCSSRRALKKPTTYVDIRKLLEDKYIDAVSIATPNHWHALHDHLGLPGRQGRLRREAVLAQRLRGAADRRGGPQVQPHRPARHPEPIVTGAAGRPCRSMREGELGEVYMARGLCYKWRDTIGKTPVEPVPAGVDYDLWTGPAPRSRSPRTASTTTGTGSGTPATATSATRASTRWTSPAGAWA